MQCSVVRNVVYYFSCEDVTGGDGDGGSAGGCCASSAFCIRLRPPGRPGTPSPRVPRAQPPACYKSPGSVLCRRSPPPPAMHFLPFSLALSVLLAFSPDVLARPHPASSDTLPRSINLLRSNPLPRSVDERASSIQSRRRALQAKYGIAGVGAEKRATGVNLFVSQPAFVSNLTDLLPGLQIRALIQGMFVFLLDGARPALRHLHSSVAHANQAAAFMAPWRSVRHQCHITS